MDAFSSGTAAPGDASNIEKKEHTMQRASPPLHPTVESFESEVLESEVPVIVDFWAEWCQPCLMLKPEMNRLAATVAGRAKVAFVNVDEQPELAGLCNVGSIPTVIVFKNGRAVDGWTGLARHDAMLARLGKHVAL